MGDGYTTEILGYWKNLTLLISGGKNADPKKLAEGMVSEISDYIQKNKPKHLLRLNRINPGFPGTWPTVFNAVQLQIILWHTYEKLQIALVSSNFTNKRFVAFLTQLTIGFYLIMTKN